MRRAQILCAVALLASACGSDATTAAPEETPLVAISPSPADTPPANPSAAVTATLNCRLPVTTMTTPGESPAGWLTFPGGQFARDPASGRTGNF